jgi:release factor glutamine methyltransferase
MTYKESLLWAKDVLVKTEQPIESARFLLRHILDKDLAYILANGDNSLSFSEEKKFKKWVKKRANHMPVWYITGYANFYGLDIKVNNNVLIPRPETELLVSRALDFIKDRSGSFVVADIGTGSGAIGLAMAKQMPNSKVYLTDISFKALNVAKKNAKINKLSNVFFLRGNLLDPIKERVDILIANLPYIPSEKLSSLALDVMHYEPRIALEGGSGGLEIYREFIQQIPSKIKGSGTVLMEIGEDQGERMLTICKAIFPEAEVWYEKDFAGLDRFVIINLNKMINDRSDIWPRNQSKKMTEI